MVSGDSFSGLDWNDVGYVKADTLITLRVIKATMFIVIAIKKSPVSFFILTGLFSFVTTMMAGKTNFT
jgi:hypothetical protein